MQVTISGKIGEGKSSLARLIREFLLGYGYLTSLSDSGKPVSRKECADLMDKFKEFYTENKPTSFLVEIEVEAPVGELTVGEAMELKAKLVRRFGELMFAKLVVHKDKGDTWRRMDPEWLLSRLKDEVAELEAAIKSGNAEAVKLECADVGNFAMFISDVVK